MIDQKCLINWQSDQSLSAVYHALRSSRRRLAVLFLASRLNMAENRMWCTGQPEDGLPEVDRVTVREIARYIVTIEEGVSENQATGDAYHNVYNSLIQSHLPRLDAVGAIQYNEDRKKARPDTNLIALATITTTTAPLAQVYFQTTVAELFSGGSQHDSEISD